MTFSMIYKIPYYTLKYWFLNTFFVKKNFYNKLNFKSLLGTELIYVSSNLCMPVFIDKIKLKGITLKGRWYDVDDMMYEAEDSVIYCIDRKYHLMTDEEYRNRINKAIHSGIFYGGKISVPFLGGGKIDRKCAFNRNNE